MKRASLDPSKPISNTREAFGILDIRKSDQDMLLDREGSRVEVEFYKAKVDVGRRQGAGHEVAKPVRDDLHKKHGVRGRRGSEP